MFLSKINKLQDRNHKRIRLLRSSIYVYIVALAGMGFACSDSASTGNDANSSTTTDGASSDGSTSTSSDAPKILSLSTNITTFGPKDTLVFSAVVTDPDGIDDLIGGKLEAPNGQTYGAFITSASEGSYSLTLTWKEVNTVEAITVPPKGAARMFKARFYDVAGHETSQSIDVVISCGDVESGCDGECADLMTSDKHCGSCNVTLDTKTAWIQCNEGKPTCQQTSEQACPSAADSNLLQCADLEHDVNHCGACGNSCAAFEKKLSGISANKIEKIGCYPKECSIFDTNCTTAATCGAWFTWLGNSGKSCNELCKALGLTCLGVHFYSNTSLYCYDVDKANPQYDDICQCGA